MHPVAPALLFVTLAAGVVALLVPALLAAAWRRRTQAPLRVFFYGMLTFFVFQPVLRMSWQVPLYRWLAHDPRWPGRGDPVRAHRARRVMCVARFSHARRGSVAGSPAGLRFAAGRRS
ncbi:YhfC family intramembrane metalloprotease [Burkholderia pyrrocinia]|uniref:YhfC family intramembrane metalloprotease n=1 Tax=Burkholderia pyrrocinia TaxID=60550 RepID=UPI001BD05D33|nr:YhfC family intramembrane metalloprotease [Burkholderia pyrrocinia]QVN20607.1 YhfC family intramembrane metalloprotease [Burkholderia pyrrocinia]